MSRIRSGFVYMAPEGDGGAGGGAPGGGAPAPAGGGAPGGGAPVPAFKDAGSARTFLTEYVHDPEVLKSVPDDKVVPWAGHVKSRVDQFGNQFPEKWRNLVAGDNAEHLKTLERFQSPKALYDSYAALRAKMSSGELKAVTPYPEKGDDAAKAAWRKDNGIPEKPTEYKFELGGGKALPDADKPVIEALQKHAHEANMRPEQFQATAHWLLGERRRRSEGMREKDAQFQLDSEDALRAEWGQGYRENVNRITAFLDGAPKGVKDTIMGARGPDGKPLGSHPQVLRWLTDLARQTNPAGVVLPGAGGNLASSIADEIASIEKFMKEDRSAYNKDEKKQARLRELYSAREKVGTRKAA